MALETVRSFLGRRGQDPEEPQDPYQLRTEARWENVRRHRAAVAELRARKEAATRRLESAAVAIGLRGEAGELPPEMYQDLNELILCDFLQVKVHAEAEKLAEGSGSSGQW